MSDIEFNPNCSEIRFCRMFSFTIRTYGLALQLLSLRCEEEALPKVQQTSLWTRTSEIQNKYKTEICHSWCMDILTLSPVPF